MAVWSRSARRSIFSAHVPGRRRRGCDVRRGPRRAFLARWGGGAHRVYRLSGGRSFNSRSRTLATKLENTKRIPFGVGSGFKARSRLRAGLSSFLASVTAAVAVGVAAQGASDRRSVWDGVYTDAQAKRGSDSYAYSCATCHAADLEGDPARDVPALNGEDFVGAWNKRTVKDLFELISKSMPKDSAGSLRAETYADIVAYLLQASEFPSGAQELAADVSLLERVGIDKTPPAESKK